MAKRKLVNKAYIKIQMETNLYCFPFETRDYQYLNVFSLV